MVNFYFHSLPNLTLNIIQVQRNLGQYFWVFRLQVKKSGVRLDESLEMIHDSQATASERPKLYDLIKIIVLTNASMGELKIPI